MENSSDVWNDFLRDTNKDESKKETNLIVLGDIYYIFLFCRWFKRLLFFIAWWTIWKPKPSFVEEEEFRFN